MLACQHMSTQYRLEMLRSKGEYFFLLKKIKAGAQNHTLTLSLLIFVWSCKNELNEYIVKMDLTNFNYTFHYSSFFVYINPVYSLLMCKRFWGELELPQ